jgi:isoleucyl-tRNA synthetase
MHVLSVALFGEPAFANVICHGVVLDSVGLKLSKKLRNYPDPLEVFETVGSDALRWYLMSSPILRGLDLRIEKDGSDVREVVRQVLNPIWSAYSFFTLYANADDYQATWRTDSTNLLDRYILAKTRQLVEETTKALDAYDLAGAAATVQGFLDALTNWYIRRSRERFWNTNDDARSGLVDRDALDTLFSVLVSLTKTTAPLLPYITEEIWSGLVGDSSVHLQDWPDADELPSDPQLVADMDQLRDAASAALSLRDSRGLRIRLPLSKAVLAGPDVDHLSPFEDLLADEINVKAVEFTNDVSEFGSFRLQPNGRVLGPRLGPEVQTVIKQAKAGEWTSNPDGTVTVGGQVLEEGEFELRLQPLEGVAAAALPGNSAVVVLDTEMTPELEAEGYARDLVRLIQQERKDRQLQVTDRIRLTLDLPAPLQQALSPHLDWVQSQVLAVDLADGDGDQLPASGSIGESRISFDLETVA